MMNVVTGAMGALLPMLGELLKEEYNLQKGVKKDVEFLEKELKTMHATLYKVAEVPRDQLDKQVRLWADEVREMSYNADDIIDAFLVRVDSLRTTNPDCSFKRLMEKMDNVLKKANARRQIATAIKDIKRQVQEAADRRDRYRLEGVVATQAASATTSVDPRLLALYKHHKEIIGIKEPQNEVIKRLTCGDDDVSKKQRKILSIVGVGGLGKTTLAKVVYDRLQGKFDLRAFVSVGRNPDVKKVFKDILLELDKDKYMNSNVATWDERQLINELRGLLENQRQLINELRGLLENENNENEETKRTKRYFIVIDDIWDIKSWEIISCALVDNNQGSRIITTTRILEVARKADDVYELAPLSCDKSQELFYTRLLGGKGKCPHDQPIEVSEKIFQKCGGVPLPIITIASLLVSKPMKDWPRVYNSIGFGREENKDVENTRKILLLSYYDLSYCLRSCLLHIGVFPEDYLIKKKKTLIWMWVAEGFVQEEPGIGLFELGERYFNELINRSMIQPVQEFGIIDGCRVHDMVLDMICSLAKEENFFTTLDSNEQHASSQSIARRLTIQERCVDQHVSLSNTQMPKVRSFTATRCDFNMAPALLSFRCLRVLAIEKCSFMEGYGSWHLGHLGKLLQLRYLGLLETPICKLPEEVGDLKFLQTLDLRDTTLYELPQSVGRLRRLKCLRTSCEVSDWIGNLTSLEALHLRKQQSDLSPNFVEELGKLAELRELNIGISGLHESGQRKALVESLGNLWKIQVLELYGPGIMFEEGDWEGFVPPPQLRHMFLMMTTSRIPGWISPSLVPKLSILRLEVEQAVESKDVEILGMFSELTVLKLNVKWCRGPPDVMGGGAFPKLSYLFTSVPFRFLQGAMPRLEELQFRANFDFDFGLGNLPSLQKVTVEIPSEMKDAEAALRHAVDIHPNHPILHLKR